MRSQPQPCAQCGEPLIPYRKKDGTEALRHAVSNPYCRWSRNRVLYINDRRQQLTADIANGHSQIAAWQVYIATAEAELARLDSSMAHWARFGEEERTRATSQQPAQLQVVANA